MPETRETIAVLARQLDALASESLADLVVRQDGCVQAARDIARRARAAGRSDAVIFGMGNFRAATAEAELLTIKIEREAARRRVSTESIDRKWDELERLAASVPARQLHPR